MKTNTDRASGEMRTVLQHADRRQQAVTVLSEQDLEIVAGAAGKKGGTPEFRF